MKPWRQILVLATLLGTSIAWGQETLVVPVITPSMPTTSDVIVARLQGDTGAIVRSTGVRITGDQIFVELAPGPIFSVPVHADVPVTIGKLPAGTYTLTAQTSYLGQSPDKFVVFAVADSPNLIPAWGASGALLTVLAILLIAARALWRRRS